MNTVVAQYLQEERVAELHAQAARNRLGREAKPSKRHLRMPRLAPLRRVASRRRVEPRRQPA